MFNLLNKLLRQLAWLAFVYCLVVIVILGWPLTGWLLAIVGFLRFKFRKSARPTVLGSARFAEKTDLAQAGMLGADRGLILGRSLDAETRRSWPLLRSRRPEPFVRLPNALHVAVFGPSGAGKGVSFVIPTLLTEACSAVVLDFKGELAIATAEYRRRVLGHQVILLDPYHTVTNAPDTFNPIDFIRAEDSLAIDDCNDLGAALVVRTGNERERHWDDCAEMCIASFAAAVVAHGKENTRSLQTVREMLSHPKSFELAAQLMAESDNWGGALSRLGGQLMHFEGKERSSVLSSTLRHLRFLGTPAIAASTASSSFDPAKLRSGKMTVYCILPPERAQAQSGLLRMWIGSMMRACVRGGLQ